MHDYTQRIAKALQYAIQDACELVKMTPDVEDLFIYQDDCQQLLNDLLDARRRLQRIEEIPKKEEDIEPSLKMGVGPRKQLLRNVVDSVSECEADSTTSISPDP
jgi:(p)ppGpp synthase/HD superfamily hydrolase